MVEGHVMRDDSESPEVPGPRCVIDENAVLLSALFSEGFSTRSQIASFTPRSCHLSSRSRMTAVFTHLRESGHNFDLVVHPQVK
jgi:hypothetical protein